MVPPTPTATHTATPTPASTPTTAPTDTPLAATPTSETVAAPVQLWETTITLHSYGWASALIPPPEDAPFAPYPTLNFDAVAPPSPRTYPAVILENAYVRLTVVPELGGRILRWDDKVTGRRLTYENPVIKPTHWGYRGWWLATGGIEWAFPVNEHGLNEYRPWDYELLGGTGWRGLRVWDTDDRTGMTIAVTLQLHADRSDVTITPRLTNPTATPHALQFWINAMLTLADGNRPSPALRFWVPTEQMIVHSTNDPALPAPRSRIDWPIYAGRDFSRYATWQRYLGLFATEARGAVGAYDESADQGIVRTYPPTGPQGVKIFCLGDLASDLYTDGDSRYFEFWGGYNRTFFPEDDVTLAPGSVLSWEERWYPVHGIGALAWADGDIAVALQEEAGTVDVGLYANRPVADVTLTLWRGDVLHAEWTPSVGPARPFRVQEAGQSGVWRLDARRGSTLLTTITPF
jgi:hypothetical protein